MHKYDMIIEIIYIFEYYLFLFCYLCDTVSPIYSELSVTYGCGEKTYYDLVQYASMPAPSSSTEQSIQKNT